mmetsp:Transcript_22616/g.29605  ORF Transcript_22616/g.29605 Transcript_22616/m.29605 type:complete len:105 (+) Transcript_22616:44-358(+)
MEAGNIEALGIPTEEREAAQGGKNIPFKNGHFATSEEEEEAKRLNRSLKALRSTMMSVSDERKARHQLITISRAKKMLAASPANDRTCNWYLKQYIHTKFGESS